MPSVQVKDVPEDVHAVLRRRAAVAGQSLQEYLRARLVEEARRPTIDEILTRSGGRAGGQVTFESATEQLRKPMSPWRSYSVHRSLRRTGVWRQQLARAA